MPRTWRIVVLAAALAVASSLADGALADETASSSCAAALVANIPSRPPQAARGDQFARSIEQLDGIEREARIRQEVLAGNVPSFLRRLVPIQFSGQLSDGRLAHIVLCAMPDYLAVGSDADFLYVPVQLGTALQIAQRFGFILPTPRMVDAIYEQASVHLAPLPLPAGDTMRSSAYYRNHSALIAQQRRALGIAPGALSAGDKKDLVLTNLLWHFPDRVAIYGWHRASGHAIQPLSTVHGWRYADYSHGARLISNQAWVDGAPRSLLDVLQDPQLARVLNGEGVIRNLPQLIAQLLHPLGCAGLMGAQAASGSNGTRGDSWRGCSDP